jgi:hypothetical protein
MLATGSLELRLRALHSNAGILLGVLRHRAQPIRRRRPLHM